MRILQINAVNKIGSTGRNVSELCEYASSMGHICAVAYSKGPSVNPNLEYIIGSKFDSKIHAFLSRLFGLQAYFSKLATWRLLKYIHKFKPDIVVLHNLHANYINLPMLLKHLAKNNIPTVTVLHDCWLFTGKCCHYTICGCYKWQVECGKCPALKKYNKSWFFDRTKKMLKDKKKLFSSIQKLGIIGVSTWITEEAKKSTVLNSAKAFLSIYNWIDAEIFKPHDTDKLRANLGFSNKKVILCVSSIWDKSKGLDVVEELAKRLNDDEVILLVGSIPKNTQLNEKTVHIERTNTVSLLADYYALADVFLQPSAEETFGKVSAEALCCGTPVVTFNSTANPELVGEGCGEVVKLGDIDAALLSIRNICSLGKGEYSQKCREFALNNFEKSKNLEKYLNFFEELIQD